MKEMNLKFVSDYLEVEIKNYSDCKFEYDKWIITDKYVFNENNLRFSQYAIVAASPSISSEKELNDYRWRGEKVIKRITDLIPVCGLPALNFPKEGNCFNAKSIVLYSEPPKGWKMNYDEINKEFQVPNKKDISIDVSVEFCRYSIIDNSPLDDLKVMMNNYDSIGEEIEFLVFLNNAILTSTDSNVYMLVGKALEIVDAIYPLKGNKDNRINNYFPELKDLYEGHTIKELMGLSNTRKESRHFVKNKARLIPHDSLSNEEGELLLKLSTNLIINVIREKFGLSHIAIMQK